ncbi:hypothetical protein NDU88_004885, partial [Pleurodeles waltl]
GKERQRSAEHGDGVAAVKSAFFFTVSDAGSFAKRDGSVAAPGGKGATLVACGGQLTTHWKEHCEGNTQKRQEEDQEGPSLDL